MFLNSMQTEQHELCKLIHQLMWHMRGSLSREEAWTLCQSERAAVITLIEERRDIVEKTGLPLM